ncbi:MAG: hypothetical protein LBG15_14850 [Dysgonamonadaceae bacterium]|jgi:hypothetical protein|nr:hypothetical protein [Dysgonamonadaceae bacterium]
METIEQKVKNAVAEGEVSYDQETCEKFEQASAHYETLLKQGVVSKRGYCLKTISDVAVFKYDKNVM